MAADYRNHRTLTTLEGVCRLSLLIRRCHRRGCQRHHLPFRPEAEGRLALPHHEFGLDVTALVGALRYAQHRSVPEIHQALTARGAPAHDTFNRIFAALDPDAFQGCFTDWINAACGELGFCHIPIDGKAVRGARGPGGACLHLVSAWVSEQRLSLGQVAVADKSNEITAIPELLRLLELRGALVSIDAIGCPKGVARQILAAGGDYLLALKENQPTLHADVVANAASEEGPRGPARQRNPPQRATAQRRRANPVRPRRRAVGRRGSEGAETPDPDRPSGAPRRRRELGVTPEDLDDNEAEEEAGAPVGRVRTRGVGWILVPAAVGLMLGALVGPLAAGADERGAEASPWRGALAGGGAGAALGGAAGGFLWAFFPYQGGRRPDEPPAP